MKDSDPQDHSEDYLSVEELAGLLRIPKSSIYGWRSQGRGPRGFKAGRHVRYRRGEVRRWINEQMDQ